MPQRAPNFKLSLNFHSFSWCDSCSASQEEQQLLLEAGINDWGGISPITRDWVNPEVSPIVTAA